MKIRVQFSIDIDPEAWSATYGTDTNDKAIREDVRIYIENGARDQLRELGLLTDDLHH
jgi:hypothetical protein